MKKVLIITQTTNISSGWGRYSFEIIKNLQEKVEVLTLEEGIGQSKLYKKDSLESFVKNLFLSRKTARNVDIIHVLDGWPYAIYGYFAVLGTSKKLFINAVGTYSIPPSNVFIKSFLMKMAYRRASKVFSISRYTDRVLRESMPWVDSLVIHLGATSLSKPTIESNATVMSKIDSRSPIILTVGALKKRKGQIYTLKAVSELKKDYQNILYVMVGEDSDIEYKKEILSYAKENNLESNVLITGIILDDELSAWYKSSDIFALNSLNHDGHFEGFGLVLIEAASVGLSAIGSRNCGIEDAIEDGFNGYYTEQGNVDNITQKIKDALIKKEILSKNSVEFSKRFSWRRTIEIYKKYYDIGLL